MKKHSREIKEKRKKKKNVGLFGGAFVLRERCHRHTVEGDVIRYDILERNTRHRVPSVISLVIVTISLIN